MIHEEAIARPLDVAEPRQGSVEGIAGPVDDQSKAGEPEPGERNAREHEAGRSEQGSNETQGREMIRQNPHGKMPRQPRQCWPFDAAEHAVVDPFQGFHAPYPKARTRRCESAAGSTASHHAPQARAGGNAMRAEFAASPRSIRRAAWPAVSAPGVAPGKRAIIPVCTKPASTTLTPMPWGASQPRNASP